MEKLSPGEKFILSDILTLEIIRLNQNISTSKLLKLKNDYADSLIGRKTYVESILKKLL